MSFMRFIKQVNSGLIEYSGNTIASLNDRYNLIEIDNSSNNYSYTIPPHSSVPFAVMDWIEIKKTGSGDVTIAKGSGVTFSGPLGDVNFHLDGEDGYSVFLRQLNIDNWEYSGSLKSV